MARKRKQLNRSENTDIDLNIIPFIDVFSMLNTFLLFSAVFVATGILEVQVPFLSSAPPPKDSGARTLEVKVDAERDKVQVITEYSKEPRNEQKFDFPNSKEGIGKMHEKLVEIRRGSPDTDKITFFSEDDVIYENVAAILDAVKFRLPADPKFPAKNPVTGAVEPDEQFLFPKIVMGSVML
jgi:biopolymer transport protein ExbD